MFTGIVEELGTVRRIGRQSGVLVLSVEAATVTEATRIGDSIAVNGACLTVVKNEKKLLTFEVMMETARLTTLGALRPMDKVNLERSLKVGDRVGGHFVSGHIDCIGTIRTKQMRRGSLCFAVALPAGSAGTVKPKGSIALDGISLTVAEVRPPTVTVYIIPHTLEHTTLGFKGPSDKVNVEFDMLAKKGVRF